MSWCIQSGSTPDDVEPTADRDRSYRIRISCLLHLPTTIDPLPSHHASTGNPQPALLQKAGSSVAGESTRQEHPATRHEQPHIRIWIPEFLLREWSRTFPGTASRSAEFLTIRGSSVLPQLQSEYMS